MESCAKEYTNAASIYFYYNPLKKTLFFLSPLDLMGKKNPYNSEAFFFIIKHNPGKLEGCNLAF